MTFFKNCKKLITPPFQQHFAFLRPVSKSKKTVLILEISKLNYLKIKIQTTRLVLKYLKQKIDKYHYF